MPALAGAAKPKNAAESATAKRGAKDFRMVCSPVTDDKPSI
jgi:hypothetical protein